MIRFPSMFLKLFTSCLAIGLIATSSAQQIRNQTLFKALEFTANPASPGLLALFPASIIEVETPVAVRYALLTSIAAYQIFAACDPKALSFLGTKDPVNKEKVCDPLSRLITFYQYSYLLKRKEFPFEAAGIAQFLVKNGLDPFDSSASVDTAIGWSYANSGPVIRYFENDGWNSLGSETKEFYRFPFQDTTKYTPQNNPYTSPKRLFRPLRWQPLSFTDRRGRFGHQIHVVPHIGIKSKPLVLSMDDYLSRKAPSPYRSPNTVKKIRKTDERKIRGLMDKVFTQTRTLTEQRIAEAFFWDNKFISLGSFIFAYQQKLNLTAGTFVTAGAFGEMMAQYDAVLVAWKEKRRHDLVRPTTMIRRFFSGKLVNAYRGVGLGNGMMPADEWEPILPVQPHSEYPSGSAVICTASLERLQLDLEKHLGPNATIPAYEQTLGLGGIPKNPYFKDFTFKYNTPKEAAMTCGNSRLYGGVHFEPSVSAGNKLAEGIGKAAFEHVNDLLAGRVPKNCMRCK